MSESIEKPVVEVVQSGTWYGSFGCEEAGTFFTLSCGHTVIDEGECPPNYCSTCGRPISHEGWDV